MLITVLSCIFFSVLFRHRTKQRDEMEESLAEKADKSALDEADQRLTNRLNQLELVSKVQRFFLVANRSVSYFSLLRASL